MKSFLSERLIYSKFIESDYQYYHQLSSDEQVMHYITGRALSMDESKERFQKILDLNKNYDLPGVFIVRDKVNKEFLGLAKATEFNQGQIEIGYALMPAFWGQGLGSEISIRMVDYSRKIENVTSIIGIINPTNKASKHILEKSGLSFFEERLINKLPGAIYKMNL